jgi:protein phosphatase
MLTDPEIRDTLAAYENNLPDAADELVRQANANGGLDNISVILIRVSGDDGSAAR